LLSECKNTNNYDRAKVRDFHSGWTLSAGTALASSEKTTPAGSSDSCFSRWSRHPPFQSLKLAYLFTYGLMILSVIIRVSVYIFEL